MVRIEPNKNINQGADILDILISKSNNKCFFTEEVLQPHEMSVYPSTTYSNGNYYLLKKALFEYIKENSIDLLDLVCPYSHEPKYFIFLLKNNHVSSLRGFQEKGQQTVSLIEEATSRKYNRDIKTHLENLEKSLAEINNLRRGVKNVNLVVYKKVIHNFIPFLKNHRRDTNYSAITASFILSSPYFDELIHFIDNNKSLDLGFYERAKLKINEYKNDLLEIRLFNSRYFLWKKIEASLKNCDYKTVIKIFKKYQAPQKLISYVKTIQQLFDNEGVEDIMFFKDTRIRTIISSLEAEKSTFTSFGLSPFNFLQTVRNLSIAQKLVDIKFYKNALLAFSWFFEVYCNGLKDSGSKGGGGMWPKFNNMRGDITNKKYLEIKDTLESAIKASEHNSHWIKLNKERNAIAHEGKGISESEFYEKCEYLLESVTGIENHSNLAQKWYLLFGLPEQNIFDQFNNEIERMVKSFDF